LLLPIPFYIFVFIFGAVVGSFLNVCIYRLPAGKSIVSPPSSCPVCQGRIKWYDNIPIVSWLLLRGRCRGCSSPISPRYPVVEALNGLFTLALFYRLGPLRVLGLVADPAASTLVRLAPTLTFVALFLFCSAMVVITFIDLDHMIIPDVISLPGIVVGFLFSCFIPQIGWLNSLLGILAGGGSLFLVAALYHRLTGKEGMGGGDIKLLAMMGAFFGWKAIPFIVFMSSLIGSVVGIALMLAQKKDGKLAIPFGPFLALGAILYIFYGRQMILWYLRLGGQGS
jgi:leader peptidase (prepilin peptidase)/N-methyltransferase